MYVYINLLFKISNCIYYTILRIITSLYIHMHEVRCTAEWSVKLSIKIT